MPSSLRRALLLRGAGCFSADAVESLGNCSLQCHCGPIYSLSPTSDFRLVDKIHPRSIDVQRSPGFRGVRHVARVKGILDKRACRTSGVLVHFVDCLIAAVARAEDSPVATFDEDFRKFGDVRIENA